MKIVVTIPSTSKDVSKLPFLLYRATAGNAGTLPGNVSAVPMNADAVPENAGTVPGHTRVVPLHQNRRNSHLESMLRRYVHG